ncbi:MAG: hypothetical protein NVSMB57_14040 [Actinomycetota bacterium]
MTPWRARWIWIANAPKGEDVHVLARRSFTLPNPVKLATIRITSDGHYALTINGQPIGRGPVRSEPHNLTYDAYECSLHQGENVIAVHVRHYGRPTLYWKPAQPRYGLGHGGLLAEVIDGPDIATDASWRVRQAPYRAVASPPQEGAPDSEDIDGRTFPHGWTESSFNDFSWDHATELGSATFDGSPFGPLPPRPIAHLVSKLIPVSSISLEADQPKTIDLGLITNAHVKATIEAATDTRLEIRCAEELVDTHARLDVRDWALTYTAAACPPIQTFEAFEPIGFRYLQLRSSSRAVVSIEVHERTYPRAAGAAFRCSDPLLNEIWNAGARTLDLCSTDAFIDCPGREQRAWLGDDYVVSLVSFVCNPDTSLPIWDLRLHAAAPRDDGLLPMVAAGDFTDRAVTLPDYSLLWVMLLARIWEHTGDAELLSELLPTATTILAAFESKRDGNGLLTGFGQGLDGWVFIDWAQIERGDYIAALDAMYFLALDDYARLCDAAGHNQQAHHARILASSTRTAFERYWDTSRGVFVDAAWRDGGTGRRVSQQTNSLAILAGFSEQSILDFITDDARLVITKTPGDPGTFAERINSQFATPEGFDDERNVVTAQPFFAHFLHQAIARENRFDLLLPSIRRWGAMLRRGNGCLEEYWTCAPGLGSLCHAWSATPTFDLVRHVLGVGPATPGWAQAMIEPQLGDLEWAEGSVPTPLGFIHVRAVNGEKPVIDLPAGMRRYRGSEMKRGR